MDESTIHGACHVNISCKSFLSGLQWPNNATIDVARLAATKTAQGSSSDTNHLRCEMHYACSEPKIQDLNQRKPKKIKNNGCFASIGAIGTMHLREE